MSVFVPMNELLEICDNKNEQYIFKTNWIIN